MKYVRRAEEQILCVCTHRKKGMCCLLKLNSRGSTQAELKGMFCAKWLHGSKHNTQFQFDILMVVHFCYHFVYQNKVLRKPMKITKSKWLEQRERQRIVGH